MSGETSDPATRFLICQALLKAGNTNAAARELNAASESEWASFHRELLAKVDTLRSALSKRQQSARNRWMLIAIFAGTALTFLVLMSVSRSSTVAASLQVRGVRFTTANEVTVGALDTRWIDLSRMTSVHARGQRVAAIPAPVIPATNAVASGDSTLDVRGDPSQCRVRLEGSGLGLGHLLVQPGKAVDPDPPTQRTLEQLAVVHLPPSDQRWPNNNSESPRANAGEIQPGRLLDVLLTRCHSSDSPADVRVTWTPSQEVSFDGETGAAIVLETRSSPETADLLDRRLAIQSLSSSMPTTSPPLSGEQHRGDRRSSSWIDQRRHTFVHYTV